MWTRLQQGRGRRAVFICKSGSSRAMRLRCICNARRGGAWPGGTRVAHGQAGGELQSRKYDERWRDEGLSCNSDFTSLARVYEDVFTRGGPTKLESYIHNIYKFQRLLNRDGVNRCALVRISWAIRAPLAGPGRRRTGDPALGPGSALYRPSPPPPRPSGSLPLVSPRHGRGTRRQQSSTLHIEGPSTSILASIIFNHLPLGQVVIKSEIHRRLSGDQSPSSSTTFHLDESDEDICAPSPPKTREAVPANSGTLPFLRGGRHRA